MTDAVPFDAFLSYSHEDAVVVEALERRLRRFGCPWYRRRSFRLFRDVSTLAASDSLPAAVEAALHGSRFLLVLASPSAARSQWVDREIRYWTSLKGTSSIILVRLSGRLPWGMSAECTDASALPPALAGAYIDEPLYVDLAGKSLSAPLTRDVQRAVAQIAARLKGTGLDDILGDDLRAHRRAWQAALGAASLFIALIAAGGSAYHQAQRERAEKYEQRALALSRQLAAVALADLQKRDLRVAALNAVAAVRASPTHEARAALIDVLVASRYLSAELSVSRVPIGALALSPDGRTLVTGDNAGEITFWTLPDAIPSGRFPGVHPNGVSDLAFSPNGGAVASAGSQSEVLIWDPAELTRPQRVPGLKAFSLSFAAKGDYMFAGGDGGQLVAWPLNGGSRSVRANPDDVSILDIAVDASGTRLVTGGFGPVRLWSVPDLRPVAAYDPEPATGAYVDITPDGKTVLMAGGESAKLWDVDDAEPYGDPYQSPSEGVGMTRFLGKGREFAVLVGPDLYAWWVDRRRLGFHTDDIHSLLVDRLRQRLFTGGADGSVRIWSLWPRNGFVKAIPYAPGGLSPDVLALSADGRFVAIGASDRRFDFLTRRVSSTRAELRIFDVETGLAVGLPHEGHAGAVSRLALTRDGTRLASASTDGTVRLWRSDSSTAVAVVEATADQRPTDIAFDDRGALAVAFDGGPLRLLDDTGVVFKTAAANAVSALAVLPDRELLFAMHDGELRRWQLDGGIDVLVCAAPDPPREIQSLSVTAAGTAALVSHDRGVERVDLRDCSRTLVALPTAGGRSVAATPRLAISETAGGTLTAWDLEANRALGVLEQGSEQYLRMTSHAVAAAAAVDRVAAVVDDVPVVFDLAGEVLVQRACEVARLLNARLLIDDDRERTCAR